MGRGAAVLIASGLAPAASQGWIEQKRPPPQRATTIWRSMGGFTENGMYSLQYRWSDRAGIGLPGNESLRGSCGVFGLGKVAGTGALGGNFLRTLVRGASITVSRPPGGADPPLNGTGRP